MGERAETKEGRRDVFLRHDVFVVGGQPTVTYNPRSTQGIDQHVREYLNERGRILCITGPTKSGKTVLVRSVVPNAIRISGGEIADVQDFWRDIADELAGWTEEISEEGSSEEGSTSEGVTGGIKVLGTGGEIEKQTTSNASRSARLAHVRTRDPRRVAKAELLRLKPPVVIDDFHHVEPEAQRDIIRGVKDLVFDGVPVILVAVPHRAADVVRAEREMQGRIENLPIDVWSLDELRTIAEAGFEALNVKCSPALVERLAEESYGSPHLMQDFCLQLCKENDIRETRGEAMELDYRKPQKVHAFFRSMAEGAPVDDTYRRLAQGPRQRTDRKPRKLIDGVVTDIYGAVLAAIASTGPDTELSWTDIRAELKRVMMDDPPSRGEYVRVLEHMAEIAMQLVWDDENQRYVGDPVLEFDADLGVVQISDPFFAYQLRWGDQASGNG